MLCSGCKITSSSDEESVTGDKPDPPQAKEEGEKEGSESMEEAEKEGSAGGKSENKGGDGSEKKQSPRTA